MKPKRIFIISTEFAPGPGGIGAHAYQISGNLYKLGWSVNVFTEQNNYPEEEIVSFNRNSPFKIHRLLPTPTIFLLLKKFFKLFFLVVKKRPDIILGTGKHGVWFAWALGKLSFTKVVAIGHGTEFTITKSTFSHKINNWAYSHCNLIIHVSNYTKKIAIKSGVRSKNQVVINNGADGDLFKKIDEITIRKFKEKTEIATQKIIVTIGNQQPRKGHEWVIRALPQILKTNPTAHYYCIGLPSIQNYLQNIATELGVQEHVHFTGVLPNEELLLWLNACNVFAMTSVATPEGDIEGFGIAILEAAMCGKPAVVTKDSGPGEAIVEGKTGFGVGEKDIAGITEKISLLLQNDDLRQKMGEAAFINATQNSTWAAVVKKYELEMLSLLK